MPCGAVAGWAWVFTGPAVDAPEAFGIRPASGLSPPEESDTAKPERSLPRILSDVITEFRPSAHVERLELMDLLAVKECTDHRFLPARFREMSLAEVNRRISTLKIAVGDF